MARMDEYRSEWAFSRSPILAAELKELEPKIQQAEEIVLKKRREYDAAVEEMARLLEERDRLSKGIDGGRVKDGQISGAISMLKGNMH